MNLLGYSEQHMEHGQPKSVEPNPESITLKQHGLSVFPGMPTGRSAFSRHVEG